MRFKYFTIALLKFNEFHGGTLETELQSFQIHNKLQMTRKKEKKIQVDQWRIIDDRRDPS